MRFKESSCECLAPYPVNNLTSAPDCLGSTTRKQITISYESIIKGWDKLFFGNVSICHITLELSVHIQIKEAKVLPSPIEPIYLKRVALTEALKSRGPWCWQSPSLKGNLTWEHGAVWSTGSLADRSCCCPIWPQPYFVHCSSGRITLNKLLALMGDLIFYTH